MACEHFQPQQLIELAKQYVQENAISQDQWQFKEFSYTENISTGTFKSVMTKVAYKNNQWLVVVIDRRVMGSPAQELGFKVADISL